MNFSNHKNEHIDTKTIKIEVNIDDMSAEILGYLMDKLISEGANDVFYTSIHMKKNRPAIMLQVLCAENELDKMKEIIFLETTTFGLRYFPLEVHRLERRFISVNTKWGPVTIKEGLFQGEVVQRSPEYEDCKRISNEVGIPLKDVYTDVWRKL
ncbi:pyridinium-3,5-bisthiocarboxylic acid mononucleotide nickel chelatase [Bacillaceae bacterium IKA-2]|nr:pyridinium-3,5-bisthiocarboxylic acid mononucleotide nickel chelatase [Bacillaceae bacterium IKA-2]